MPPFLTFLKTWWVLIVAFAMVIGAGVRAQIQIEELYRDRQQDSRQWEIIRANLEASQNHDARLRAVERHVTPAAIQKWGEVQSLVAAHERKIEALQNAVAGMR
jgi:hypothetical protein